MVRRTISLFLYLPKTREVILSRRREDQSYPGLLQPTAHGDIEEGEDELTAIGRELKEETNLSIERVEQLRRISSRSSLTVTSKTPLHTFYWIGAIDGRAAQAMKPTPEVSEFQRITKEYVGGIRKYSQQKDANRSFVFRALTMFDDDREVLTAFLETIATTTTAGE